ncbi:uncharacterized protein PGTG_02752 [Puccinia graminis f. sp. tritici CRL 75-36-700-3]|uniref:Uncharacterized protein n=1 Tax=Puccinia graminis f. sp. tritici (strain CRL 75-36-700-3 / race SCCL) TaxID=418459 RepID=E3JW86_PUCGT|nr:uncharacterized protein PGTG_02752 [Puccinia graminis f. sp. tritici CRL 75-36-700-3]EFP76311.1 hypothetical protein PGTG_02752 [Puccinia graminis f. sp. tritici CRL 75-36-700-3]
MFGAFFAHLPQCWDYEFDLDDLTTETNQKTNEIQPSQAEDIQEPISDRGQDPCVVIPFKELISKLIHQTNNNQQRLEEGKESHSTMILIASKSVYFGIGGSTHSWEARSRPRIIVKASAYKLPSRSLPQSARIECKPSGPSNSWRKKFITRFMNMRQSLQVQEPWHWDLTKNFH